MTEKVVWYKRIWTRDAKDLRGGPMSSMHGHIKVDEDTKWIKAELIFRDCDSKISYEHWVEGKKRHVTKALKSLYKVRAMLDEYIKQFEAACESLDLKNQRGK